MVNHFCDYCQSFPDDYYCSHPFMFWIDKEGKKKPRTCVFECIGEDFYYGEEIHPCPFFKGALIFSNGKIKKVEKENTLFIE